ncbi:FAD:protein FMN transferase [Nocardioides sp. CBS4Y-1]|uniref:FAD:protein FMN transferase n=2 Tax=Nocardioides acrostichi TaxID=2784339 RepID=A0A930UXN8_9ACTN|nr:FAD:protein FMN transferase [Nocardioides acrostichi]
MGMPVSVALRGRHADDDLGRGAWAEAIAALRDVDRVFSTYRPDSTVSRLADGDLALDDCPPEVREVLDIAERASAASGGAFDVRATGRLDPSGVVKGWAVERAARPLLHLDDTDVCLSAGGDMVCRVASLDRPAWRVGIEDPRAPGAAGRLIGTVSVRDGAVATSGSTHRGQHVVHARSGKPPAHVLQVSVVAGDLVTADLDATSALALDDAAPAWLERRRRQGHLVAALVVWRDGRTLRIA